MPTTSNRRVSAGLMMLGSGAAFAVLVLASRQARIDPQERTPPAATVARTSEPAPAPEPAPELARTLREAPLIAAAPPPADRTHPGVSAQCTGVVEAERVRLSARLRTLGVAQQALAAERRELDDLRAASLDRGARAQAAWAIADELSEVAARCTAPIDFNEGTERGRREIAMAMAILKAMKPVNAAAALSRWAPAHATAVLARLPARVAAKILAHMSPVQGAAVARAMAR